MLQPYEDDSGDFPIYDVREYCVETYVDEKSDAFLLMRQLSFWTKVAKDSQSRVVVTICLEPVEGVGK